VIGELEPVKRLDAREQVIFYARQEWIRRTVEDLDRCDVGAKGPVVDEMAYGVVIGDDDHGSLQVVAVEHVADAVGAIEWTADDVVEAQSGLPIVYDLT
jgi:hypothetical protein